MLGLRPPRTPQTSGKRMGRGKGWRDEEDLLLCKCFCHAWRNARTGSAARSSDGLWYDCEVAYRAAAPDDVSRSHEGLRKRMQKIRHDVISYDRAVERARQDVPAGAPEDVQALHAAAMSYFGSAASEPSGDADKGDPRPATKFKYLQCYEFFKNGRMRALETSSGRPRDVQRRQKVVSSSSSQPPHDAGDGEQASKDASVADAAKMTVWDEADENMGPVVDAALEVARQEAQAQKLARQSADAGGAAASSHDVLPAGVFVGGEALANESLAPLPRSLGTRVNPVALMAPPPPPPLAPAVATSSSTTTTATTSAASQARGSKRKRGVKVIMMRDVVDFLNKPPPAEDAPEWELWKETNDHMRAMIANSTAAPDPADADAILHRVANDPAFAPSSAAAHADIAET